MSIEKFSYYPLAHDVKERKKREKNVHEARFFSGDIHTSLGTCSGTYFSKSIIGRDAGCLSMKVDLKREVGVGCCAETG